MEYKCQNMDPSGQKKASVSFNSKMHNRRKRDKKLDAQFRYYGIWYHADQKYCFSDPTIGCRIFLKGMRQVPLIWMIVSNIEIPGQNI